MSHLARIADRVLNTPLLLLPAKAETILSVLAGRIGVSDVGANRFEGEDVVARDANGNPTYRMEPFRLVGNVAVITITGSLVNRGAWVGASSGLTSYEGIQHQLKRAAAHEQVRQIVLDMHSPGGEAVGAFETAALVRQVNASKPVTALVAGMAASAAYAIASGASRIVTTETGVSGSIGVVLLHADYSQKLADDGIKPTLIFAGAHKVDGNPFEPLSDNVKTELQAEVNAFYEAFLKTVAAGRGQRMTAEMARNTEARTLIGQAAVDAGLVDGVGTFESVLADLSSAKGRATPKPGARRMDGTKDDGAPAAENAGITKADLDAAVAKATADAETKAAAKVEAERARMAALDQLAVAVSGNAKGAEIIAAAKADGSSADATAFKLITSGAMQGAAKLGDMAGDDKSATAAAPAAAADGQVPQTVAGWEAEWDASADLQAAYPVKRGYVLLKQREAGKSRNSKQKGA